MSSSPSRAESAVEHLWIPPFLRACHGCSTSATGQLLTGSTLLDHAAVAVKVSDVASAHPQAGVNAADIVFVEPNGISYTRLCAVFHSRFPELVGRVRSIRPVDVPLLSPIKPVFRQHRSCPLGDALDGSPLKIPPGRTFMELPQINAGVRFT